jgi:hypothetical protein
MIKREKLPKDYVTQETTTAVDAYVAVLRNLRKSMKEKQREVTISVLFLHDNASVHKS